jgi:hypothetical protein
MDLGSMKSQNETIKGIRNGSRFKSTDKSLEAIVLPKEVNVKKDTEISPIVPQPTQEDLIWEIIRPLGNTVDKTLVRSITQKRDQGYIHRVKDTGP